MLPPENGRAIPDAMAGPPCRRWVNASRSNTRNGMAWDSMGPHGRQTTEHGESMPRQTFPASHSVNLKKALTGGWSAGRGVVGPATGEWRRATGATIRGRRRGGRPRGQGHRCALAGPTRLPVRSALPAAPPLPEKNRQSACKPGSVGPRASARRDGHSSGTVVADRLEQPTRAKAGDSPAAVSRRARPYSVLLPVGFSVPLPLPVARCALTAPFHPCLPRGAGGLLSVALSLGSPPPDVIRHRVSVEPGLSSIPKDRGRPADWPGRQ